MSELKSISFANETGNDKSTKSIRVEQIENGYLIITDHEYRDDNGEWKYECKKTFSEENPFDTDEAKELADKF